MLGRMCGKLEMSVCVNVCKVETQTTVWISLPSTNAVSLVLRRFAPFVLMPRDSTNR